MAKRRKTAPARAPRPQPTPPPAASVARPRRWRGIALLSVLALSGAAAAYWWRSTPLPEQAAADAAPPPLTLLGPVNRCRGDLPFLRDKGFGNGAFFSTSERTQRGLVALERRADGFARWQHPSWAAAGPMAAIALARDGAVFVIPAPHVSLSAELAGRQNRVWRVDPLSGEMRTAIELPVPMPVSARNPFGTLGLAYDCDSHLLYVSSVAGSTPSAERGSLFQLALQPDGRAELRSRRDGIDAFGLAVAATSQGKRLIYGRARTGEVEWIALDAAGGFAGTPERIASLAGLGPDGRDKPRRIDVSAEGIKVHGTSFEFNLQQPPAGRAAYHYLFRFDPEREAFEFSRVEVHAGR